jgi:ribosome biogenesis GTPase
MQYVYKEIGYKCLRISSNPKNKGRKELKEFYHEDKVSMFCRTFSVGKSTLVNALEPTLHLKTNISKHARTILQLFLQKCSIYLWTELLASGIKGFGIVDMERKKLADIFLNFLNSKNSVKFNNCLHKDEPKC